MRASSGTVQRHLNMYSMKHFIQYETRAKKLEMPFRVLCV